MNSRLQKKCFVASMAMHVLLLAVVLFGSAFASWFEPERPKIGTVQHVYAASLVEAALSSGGNPEAHPVALPPPVAPDPAPQPKTVVPPTAPPKPTFAQSKPVVAPPVTQTHAVKSPVPTIAAPKIQPIAKSITLPPKQKKVEHIEEAKPVEWDEPTSKKTAKTLAKLDPNDLKPVKQSGAESEKAKVAAAEAAQARATARAAAQRRAAFTEAMNSLNQKLEPAAMVKSTPGPGGDGPLATNYRDLIATKYTDAWAPPAGLTDESATVTVSVTVGRDGRVISSHITRESGNISMDKSIRITLENVTYIAPFPEVFPESERTFVIEFNLKSKRLNG